ncbi:hypothetical protein BJ170DRAFT_684198 [Xylariales sp. AK1849]|nr:hypothetical protein BJ170DRAFT_684198 [Xylariales sp. AK1849]
MGLDDGRESRQLRQSRAARLAIPVVVIVVLQSTNFWSRGRNTMAWRPKTARAVDGE